TRSLSLSLSLSLSVTHKQTKKHTHTLYISLTTPSIGRFLTFTHSHTHTHTHTHTQSNSHSHTHTPLLLESIMAARWRKQRWGGWGGQLETSCEMPLQPRVISQVTVSLPGPCYPHFPAHTLDLCE